MSADKTAAPATSKGGDRKIKIAKSRKVRRRELFQSPLADRVRVIKPGEALETLQTVAPPDTEKTRRPEDSLRRDAEYLTRSAGEPNVSAMAAILAASVFRKCDDPTLVAAVIAGDREAIVEFLGRYTPLFLKVGAKFYQRDAQYLVHDFPHDVFLHVLDKLGGFRGEASLKTWLRKVVVNFCIADIRRKKTQMRERLVYLDQGFAVPPNKAGENDDDPSTDGGETLLDRLADQKSSNGFDKVEYGEMVEQIIGPEIDDDTARQFAGLATPNTAGELVSLSREAKERLAGQAIRLKHGEGLTVREIATRWSCLETLVNLLLSLGKIYAEQRAVAAGIRVCLFPKREAESLEVTIDYKCKNKRSHRHAFRWTVDEAVANGAMAYVGQHKRVAYQLDVNDYRPGKTVDGYVQMQLVPGGAGRYMEPMR